MAVANELVLQQLLAKQAIHDVLVRYCRALDRLDENLLRDVFHYDAQVDYGAVLYQGGITDFIPFTLQFQGAMRDTQHYLSNVLIAVNGSVATAESYVYAYHVFHKDGEKNSALVELIVGARYLDELCERDGHWRIAKRTEVIDWGTERVLPEDWVGRNAGLNRGLHNSNDRSCQLFSAN